jgi:hypothetical protein
MRIKLVRSITVVIIFVAVCVGCNFLKRDFKTIFAGTYQNTYGRIVILNEDGTCKVKGFKPDVSTQVGSWDVISYDMAAITELKFGSTVITCYLNEEGGCYLHSFEYYDKPTIQYNLDSSLLMKVETRTSTP